MKSFLIIAGLIVVLLGGAIWWSKSLESKDTSIITKSGLHWHPQIEIYVDGVKQEVPANIGIGPDYVTDPAYDPGMGMSAIHTHTPDGIIHFEFSGKVSTDDTKLRSFFRIWRKDVMSFGSSLTMTVNGVENSELANYPMKGGDKIVLRYTK